MPQLYAIRAASAPVALVIAHRGAWFHLARWDLKTGKIDRGAWLKGRIYQRRSEVSPDGAFFCYFGMKGGRAFHAVSRVPWLTALAWWPADDTYSRGWHFEPAKGAASVAGAPEQGSIAPLADKHGLCLVASDASPYGAELRRGWLVHPQAPRRPQSDIWHEKTPHWLFRDRPSGDERLELRDEGYTRGRLEGRAPRYTLDGEPLDDVVWADWDARGRLLVATRTGSVEIRNSRNKVHASASLADFAPDPSPAPATRGAGNASAPERGVRGWGQRTTYRRVVRQARTLQIVLGVRLWCFSWALITACGSCYRLPLWKGDIHVTPLERAAIKKCGDGHLTEEGRLRLTREPYLQSTTTSGVTVAFGTKDARGEVVVREPATDAVVARARATYVGEDEQEDRRRRAQHHDPIAANDIYVVAAKLTRLQPTHLYCYQVLVDDVALTTPAPMTTAAAPQPPEPVRFVAVGDTGTGGPAQEAIAKRMSESPYEFILFLGDIAYPRGAPSEINAHFFAVYKNLLKYVPAFPAIGNHERRTKEGRPYFEAFVLPGTERFYSFNWGDVHFVAIDTTHRDADQLVWLEDDLSKNKLPWVIVYGHHPMYTNSLRGPQMWIRKAFAKIVTDHHVDIVLTGHEHQYERFRIGGVNYVVSGGGGGQLTKFYGKVRSLKQGTIHHYLAFEVSATSLTMKAIDINGNLIESMQLSKQPGKPKVKVDGRPDPRANPVPPEKEIKPDEKLHDEPDDDQHKDYVPPPPEEPKPVEVKPTTSAAR